MGNHIRKTDATSNKSSSQPYIVATAFLSLLAIVGFALYGLPFFYDFFVREFGWSRTVVTSGNVFPQVSKKIWAGTAPCTV